MSSADSFGGTGALNVTWSLVIWIHPSHMPLPRAVLPAVTRGQDMELFSCLAVISVHPVSSEMAEEIAG